MKPEICGECGAKLEPAAQPPNHHPAMTTQPDPNRHTSRSAFEAAYIDRPNLLIRRQFGQPDGYVDRETHLAWKTWCRALDWRESQVCEWKRLDWFPDGSYILQSLCDGYAHDLVPGVTGAINYCPNCGRRVKIQPTTDTNHTEA